MLVTGKRIVVTGGASGIGEATVKAFAREGASVVSLDINDDAGETVVAEAAKLGPGPVIYRHVDLMKVDEVNSVLDEAARLLGGIDVLAAVAGVAGVQRPAEECTPEELHTQFMVNCRGTAIANQASFRHMRDSGGSIINYTSASGVGGLAGSAAYGAAKAAVLGWTRNVAKEWGHYLIRVNAVCPLVMTPMAKVWFERMDAETKSRYDAFYQANVALGGTLGRVEDAANVNLFLASDLSRFITGALIAVDGGMTMPR